MRQIVLIALVLLSFAVASVAADDLLSLQLSASGEAQQQTARGQASPGSATLARPVLTAKSGARLRIRWSVGNQEKTGNIPDVTLHFFLERENAIGQRVPPKPGADVVYESALVMDLAAHATGSADFVVEAPPPGTYLLRLETIGAAGPHGHEHFAAIDLKVVP